MGCQGGSKLERAFPLFPPSAQYDPYKLYSPTDGEKTIIGIVLLAIQVQAEVVVISNTREYWPEVIATALFHHSQRLQFPCPLLLRDCMGYLVPADVTGKSIHVDIHPVYKVKSRTKLVRLFLFQSDLIPREPLDYHFLT